jgi:hypothetical protein
MPILLFVISLWLWSRLAFAGVEQISEKDFRALAADCASGFAALAN